MEDKYGKKTLVRYKNDKTNILEEKCYRNGGKYTRMNKARSNSLEQECNHGELKIKRFAKFVIKNEKI